MKIRMLLCILASTAGIVFLSAENISGIVNRGGLPLRVHVFEDYETDIEKRWWLRGVPEIENVPDAMSASLPNRRGFRSGVSKDFDRKMGNQERMYRAVIFNPVPGPPMAGNTHLSFRCWLKGTGTLRCQIYSLSKGYHRNLVLKGLPQHRWEAVTVDMTQARRPDRSGGPLAKDERIDDIQFYVNPGEEVIVDDIVLFEPATGGGKRPFPRRIIFTGWFDTGKQGAGHEWPGNFKIVLHEKPKTWDAAQSVLNPNSGQQWIRVHMRGMRPLSRLNRLKFIFKIQGTELFDVSLANSQTGKIWKGGAVTSRDAGWQEAFLDFSVNEEKMLADEIRFQLPGKDSVLLVDNLLLYEPGNTK
jgi:hypothetical protein